VSIIPLDSLALLRLSQSHEANTNKRASLA